MARAAAEEAALAGRRPSEEARRLNIAQFLADNPGVDISSLKPRAFPGYTYLPGQECEFCHGSRDGERCLGSPECLFRYRAGFFTRQGGICPCCGEPLPAHLGMAGDHRGAKRAVVAIDHIIPRSRGGPTHAEWNKQLLHLKCNSSKGNQVAAPALALAAEHGIKVLDYLAAWEHPGPMPRDAEVHLLPPLLEHDGIFRSPLDRVGHRLRALCGHDFGVGWFPLHGGPLGATCGRCRARREQLGPGNAQHARARAAPSPRTMGLISYEDVISAGYDWRRGKAAVRGSVVCPGAMMPGPGPGGRIGEGAARAARPGCTAAGWCAGRCVPWRLQDAGACLLSVANERRSVRGPSWLARSGGRLVRAARRRMARRTSARNNRRPVRWRTVPGRLPGGPARLDRHRSGTRPGRAAAGCGGRGRVIHSTRCPWLAPRSVTSAPMTSLRWAPVNSRTAVSAAVRARCGPGAVSAAWTSARAWPG